MPSVADLVHEIGRRRDAAGRPIVVGVSGYGGAGKTTLAGVVAAAMPGVVVVRGDDYLDPVASRTVSDDWAALDRERLIAEVLEPARAGRPVVVRATIWPEGGLAEAVVLPAGDVYLVEAVGLLHPSVLPWLDLAVWLDAPLHVATARGIARSHAEGIDHDRLWTDVWQPTEVAFDARFAPRDHADLVVDGFGLPSVVG